MRGAVEEGVGMVGIKSKRGGRGILEGKRTGRAVGGDKRIMEAERHGWEWRSEVFSHGYIFHRSHLHFFLLFQRSLFLFSVLVSRILTVTLF